MWFSTAIPPWPAMQVYPNHTQCQSEPSGFCDEAPQHHNSVWETKMRRTAAGLGKFSSGTALLCVSGVRLNNMMLIETEMREDSQLTIVDEVASVLEDNNCRELR